MKKKMKLTIEALEVDSFRRVAAGPAPGGTVRGHRRPTLLVRAHVLLHLSELRADRGVPEATCDGIGTYCGTYPEVGCPNSWVLHRLQHALLNV